MTTEGFRDYTRTIAALAAFDAADEAYLKDLSKMGDREAQLRIRAIEDLGEAVGVAFGLDTSDINNPETCKQCVRPGPKVPGPGAELSFVRRMVAKYHKPKPFLATLVLGQP